ncbi:unnamed protein product [Diatraea saccharalis]|uniref:acylphosphatase n=1 Tax=Diatraea saccharalis TaxID=40085 RepID=A0A9N9R1B9_9NEOP|nr:unnamed protein product [Diatraea saccharalis]
MYRILLLTILTSHIRAEFSTAVTATMKAIDFEIYGRVQGVFFRKFTKQQADKLGLRGWCKNTSQGTVLGHIQGPSEQIESMMQWLKTTGSPSSQIEKAEFRNQKDINEYNFTDFSIMRD